jgi:DNA repair protein RAD50
MSSLFKLSIKGIRAFEPEQEETIQFGFPLTLICGQNGCGKTTIIECLKYATTGDLPPNSKGGAFVNDPSLTGRTNITGQVKLAFRNANGKSMITTRTIQLSRKKGRNGAITNTFKTLEGQLVVIDKGNKVSVSTKNAELDSQTPIYLGASRAILDYVIFCHQDDSLWPLSEASVLKKRFDDIFEASKFTKVLDNLKTIKKDMTVDIKLIEQSVKHLKIDKDRSKKIYDKLNELTESSEKYNEELANVNLQLDQKVKESDELFSLNQDFQATISEYERLNHEQRLKTEQAERLKNNIEILEASDEELLDLQNNAKQRTQEKKNQIERSQIEHNEVDERLEQLNKESDKLIRQDGILKGKEFEYQENIKKLHNLISTNLEQFKYPNSPDDLDSFQTFLAEKVTFVQEDYSSLVETLRAAETIKQSGFREILDSITREDQHQNYCQTDINSTNDKLSLLKRKLDLADNHGSELEAKEFELESSIKKLDEKKKSSDIKVIEERIENNSSTVSKLEFEMLDLFKKISTSNKQSDIKTRLTLLEESLVGKQNSLNKVIKNVEASFKEQTSTDISSNSESVLNDLLASLEHETNGLQKLLISSSAKVESTKALMKSNDMKKTECDQQLSNHKIQILKAVEEDEIETYEQVLEDLEESYRNVVEDVNTSEVTRQFNVTAISIAEKDKHCLLCKREFDSPGLSKFIEELQLSVKKDKIKEIEDQAETIKTDLTLVKSIHTNILQFRELQQTIKSTDSISKELNEKLTTLQLESVEKSNNLQKTRARVEALNSLKRPVNDISRLTNEVKVLQTQVDELSDELNDFGTAVLSISELQKLQLQKTNEIQSLRQTIEEDSESKQDIQRDIARLENKIKDSKLSISTLQRTLAETANIKATIDELEAKISQLLTKKEETSKSLVELQIKKNSLETELIKLQKENKELLNTKKSFVVKVENTQRIYSEIHLSVKEFTEVGSSRLEENTRELQRVNEEKSRSIISLKRISSDIQQLEKEVNDQSSFVHKVIANLDYRGLIKELEEISEHIISLDISNAQIRKEEYQERSKKLRNQISDLNAQHSGKSGELKQIKDQIKGLKQELQSEYKDVNSNYHQEWVKLQTNMIFSNDIQTYSKALDNAIMKFHSIKMEDINRILRELWSQTYKGSDIETIAIKSDVNVQAKGNRSYNYRVVMYKSGNELDMRGRCSAGQKVLTSILIRLALAECFGINCGIIALDEPTTNLDQENTESLAQALNQIIEFRKAQLNFQLIVITHDENFLTHIQGDRFTDHFYRIRRDEQQSSRIYSLPISKIQEG